MMSIDPKAAVEEMRAERAAYRRSHVVYAGTLTAFIVLYLGALIGAIYAHDFGLMPASGIAWTFLAVSVSVYFAAGRTATWLSDRVLRKAGIKP